MGISAAAAIAGVVLWGSTTAAAPPSEDAVVEPESVSRAYVGRRSVEARPDSAEVTPAQRASSARDEVASTDVVTEPQPEPVADTAPPQPKRRRISLRIPEIPLTKRAQLQPWVRYTVYGEWYRQNYNTQQSDDGFVAIVNRLNVGADTRMPKWTLGTQVRLDAQKTWFPTGQDCSIATDCVPIQDDIRLERATVRADSRYVSAYAGDFNVNMGRGLGLSVRKIDEIGVDATIKGGRVDLRTKPVRGTVVAGFANRQNSDFATRQLIPDPGYPAKSYTFAPAVGERACDVSGAIDPEVGNPLWTICSDFVAGGRVEGTLPGRVDVGAHYVYLDFGAEETAGVVDEHLHQVGGDVGRTGIGKVWDVFVGASGIVRNPQVRGTAVEALGYDGYGVYTSNVFVAGTTTILVEGKHYRDYLLAFSQNDLLQYTENPTLEREDQQVPGNVNATGGRMRIDHTWRDVGLTLYGNTLQYVFSEDLGFSQFGPEQRIASHNYAGIIWRKPHSGFVLQASGGYRYERYMGSNDRLRRKFPHGELALTIPVGRTRDMTHALNLRGEGRWETYPAGSTRGEFFRGFFVFGYSLSPHFSLSFVQGIDTERPTPPGEPSLTTQRCSGGSASTCRPHLWPGMQLQVNLFDASFVRLFAGRQVGGRICVNGSCRVVPDFEGIRSELVFSF